MSKIEVRQLQVLIERGKDIIVAQVPEHEVEVLKVVHGAANVRLDESAEVEVIEVDGNADMEFLRLQSRYKRINAPDPVRIAFPGGARDLQGQGFGRGDVREMPMSSQKNHKKPAVKKPAEKQPAK